ncbi:uncharacterized protein LOC62_05G007628 [Vanrija pseudolonga]|uniref:Uncharacterized protein n=1 Tax=Vanrija pseudolonga TaxID=143232 RepID=A0AAF0YGB3_9TREE|nr:hypothetical protein LOC62_05G007628 [Vanrija pseudolonga]
MSLFASRPPSGIDSRLSSAFSSPRVSLSRQVSAASDGSSNAGPSRIATLRAGNAQTRLERRRAVPDYMNQSVTITPKLSTLTTTKALVAALDLDVCLRDPAYAYKFTKAYVENKSKRRGAAVLADKLEAVERARPEHADALHAVRIAFNLPPSRVLPPPSELATLLQHSAPTARGEVTETRGARVEALMGAPVAVTRPLGADDLDVDGQAGLPAYAKDDPEPEATRLLDLRLRAIAAGGAAAGVGVDLEEGESQDYRDDAPPPPPPPPPSPGFVPRAFPAAEAAAIDPLRC